MKGERKEPVVITKRKHKKEKAKTCSSPGKDKPCGSATIAMKNAAKRSRAHKQSDYASICKIWDKRSYNL